MENHAGTLTQEEALRRAEGILVGTPYQVVQPFSYLTWRTTHLHLYCPIHDKTWTISWRALTENKKTRKYLGGCPGCREVYSKEDCSKAASQCTTRSEFEKKYPGEYIKALKKGWLDEICTHMPMVGNWYFRCIYAYVFVVEKKKFVYVGLTSNLNRRNKEHRNEKESAVYKFAEKFKVEIPTMQQLTEYLPKEEAADKEGEILQKFIADGYIPLNIMKTGGLGGHLYNDGFTYEDCVTEANKYKSRSEWKKNHYATYYVARIMGWIDYIKPQKSRYGRKDQRYWTMERCCDLAKECASISEYAEKHPVAYATVCKHKWNDVVFANIERQWERVDFDLETIVKTLKQYPSTACFAKEHRNMVNWLFHHKIKMRDIASPEQYHQSYVAGTKPIVQCDMDGNYVAEYNSAREPVGFNYKKISACCHGKNKSHNGYKWFFKQDYEREHSKE